MKSCDENQNLMSTLLPLKIVRVPHIASKQYKHLYFLSRYSGIESFNTEGRISSFFFKDKDYCPIEIIKGLTDKGQFQYLKKLMGPQEGTYLYATQFHSLR